VTLSRDGKTAYIVESDLEADLWRFDLAGSVAPPRRVPESRVPPG
jgi:hypothetical protein